MFRKIISHSLVYALAPQIPRVVSIALLPLLTAYLTPFDYGVSATVSAYSGIFSGIKDLGITVLLVNAFYHNKKNWKLKWRILYGYLLAWAPVLFTLCFVLLWMVVPAEAASNRLLICLLTTLPFLLFDHTILVGFRYYHIVIRKPKYIAMASIVSGFVTLSLNYYIIVILKKGYLGWMWATLGGTFVSFLFYIYPVIKLKLKPIFYLNVDYFKRNMRVSLPMIPHTYSAYLLNASDRMVMDVLKVNINKIGIYNLANNFGNYFEILGNAAGMGVGPFVTDLIDKKSEDAETRLRRIIFAFQVLFLAGTFLAALWMKEIFSLLISNPELQTGYWMAIIIVMGYVYRPMYWGCVNRLLYFGKTSRLWRISFIGGALSLIANFIFIPIWGFEVAVYSTYIALLYVGFSGYFLTDYRQVARKNYYPLRWLVVIISATIVVFVLKDVFWGVKVAATVGTVAALIISLKILLKKHE